MDGIQAFDQEVFKAIHLGWKNALLDPFFFVFSYMGLTQIQVLGTLVLLMWRSTKLYVLPLLVSILSAGILGQIIKQLLIPRERPSNLALAIPQEAWKHSSFPSGHTITSFSLAFMLVYVTVGTKRAWIGYVALVWAALVGLSRIYRGVHWPSDVLASMFLGAAVAAAVYLILDRVGHWLKLESPEATLTGREASEAAG